MTDEDKKRIVSEPPPPTDEIDGEWGDDDQTLVRELPEGVIQSQPVPPASAVARTAVAPISVPAAGAVTKSDDEDEDEDDDDASGDDASEDDEETSDNEDDEEDEDADDEHGATAEPAAAAAAAARADWIPEWAPFAVLGLLVTASIVFGLGLIGGESGPTADESDAAPPASALAAPKKPSSHP